MLETRILKALQVVATTSANKLSERVKRAKPKPNEQKGYP